MKIPKYLVFLLITLIIATFTNVAIHYTSPVYKYYKTNFKAINLAFEEYKKRVEKEFIPSLNLLITNSLPKVIQNSKLSKSTIVKDSNNNVINVNNTEIKIDEIVIKDYLKSYVNGREYLRLNGHIYQLGDYIMGEPLIYFDDFLAKTITYKFKKDLNKEKNNIEKGTIKNDTINSNSR